MNMRSSDYSLVTNFLFYVMLNYLLLFKTELRLNGGL